MSSFKICIKRFEDAVIIEKQENEFMFKEDSELSDSENIKFFLENS